MFFPASLPAYHRGPPKKRFLWYWLKENYSLLATIVEEDLVLAILNFYLPFRKSVCNYWFVTVDIIQCSDFVRNRKHTLYMTCCMLYVSSYNKWKIVLIPSCLFTLAKLWYPLQTPLAYFQTHSIQWQPKLITPFEFFERIKIIRCSSKWSKFRLQPSLITVDRFHLTTWVTQESGTGY